MAQHTNTVSTASGYGDYFHHLFICMLAPVLMSMLFVPDLNIDRLVSAIRQATNQSQSEVIIFLLFFLTYFAGFAKARRWSVCPGTVLKVTDPRPHALKCLAKVAATKTTATKINVQTTSRLGQWDVDTHLIKTTDWERLPSDAFEFSKLVGACARWNNTEVALYLFDHMLKTGVACDKQSIYSGTASRFFKLVATNLEDTRMQKDGIQLLQMLLAHGLSPTNLIQNQLIRSWKSKLPCHVVEVFVNMREKGVHLSATAYRCIMAAHERTEPVFTLRLYDEMLAQGIKIDRVAFNAVLCACSHLGMTSQAMGLFEQMSELGLVPNGKTYGTLIRACTSAKKAKEALELFQSMRVAGIEPNRFAFRDAIHCCVKLKEFDQAYELHKDLVAASLVPCKSTCMYIMEACQKNGCLSVLGRMQADMLSMGLGDAIQVEDLNEFKDSEHDNDCDSE